ncbi:MAG TPA: hypothetical protein VMD29_11235 [Terracidiphilus sp.]|nr:hypothetical protein [Terracidiphilus sp.]
MPITKQAVVAAGYLKNFAASGSPNGDHLPQWAPANANKPETMEIGSRTGEMPLAESARLAFWTQYLESPAGAKAPPF